MAIELYVWFSKKVFSDIKTWPKFKATVFESGIRTILGSAGLSGNVLMQEGNPICKSFVVALPSTNVTPMVFRTYEALYDNYDCTVVQAACATTATPDLFKPMSINSNGMIESFVGAGLNDSNPINIMLEEAVMLFGLSQSVACMVSIGAGNSA
ncbi:hypothetical protein C0993_012074, partial [Termitomyces sp. T159_Od127]